MSATIPTPRSTTLVTIRVPAAMRSVGTRQEE